MKEIKTIYKWIIAFVGMSVVFGGVFLWIRNDQKKDDYIQQVIFSSPEQRMATEKYMESSFSEGAMIEAKLEMTAYYEDLTIAIDTLYKTYIFVHSDIETNKLRNEAILSLVHNMDSIMQLLDERQKQMIRNIQSGKNASELNLIEIRRLKALENFSGD